MCLVRSECLQGDTLQAVTDLAALVILIQLICVTCLAAGDGCVCVLYRMRGATLSNVTMPVLGDVVPVPGSSC